MVYKMKLADISEIELDDDPFRPHSLTFTKLHGNGNDFILVDEMGREQVAESEKRRFAIALLPPPLWHRCRWGFVPDKQLASGHWA